MTINIQRRHDLKRIDRHSRVIEIPRGDDLSITGHRGVSRVVNAVTAWIPKRHIKSVAGVAEHGVVKPQASIHHSDFDPIICLVSPSQSGPQLGCINHVEAGVHIDGANLVREDLRHLVHFGQFLNFGFVDLHRNRI
jgi:hypothetical protein